MRKAMVTAIMVIMLFCTAYADNVYILCRPDDYVNIRMFPSTNSEAIGQLDCGDSIETDGVTRKDKKGRTWVHVCGLEGGGWVCSRYVQETPVNIVSYDGYVSANGRTAVRRSPNGKVVKWLHNGDDVCIIAMSDEWALTKSGYIKKELLDVYD